MHKMPSVYFTLSIFFRFSTFAESLAQRGGKKNSQKYYKTLAISNTIMYNNSVNRIECEREVVMAKTENIYIRVEPQVKAQAEQVLGQLGIPMSNAVGMFLHQVVLQKGLPFEVKLPQSKPTAFGSLTDEDFDNLMGDALADYSNGKTIPAKEVRKQMKGNLVE